MHAHRIDSFLVSENVRIEIVHEANPFFASEPISVIVRLRHLGSQNDFTKLKEKLRELHEDVVNTLKTSETQESSEGQDSKSWSVKSLFSGLSKSDVSLNTLTKAQDENIVKTREHTMKLIQYHKPVHLISGFVQVTGNFQFDTSVINDENFNVLGKKKVASNLSKIEITTENNNDNEKEKEINHMDKNDVMKYVNTDYNLINGGLISKNENQLVGSENSNLIVSISNMTKSNSYKNYPIFLIPQSLLFSELTLNPGEVKTFYYKSNSLPNDLPPSLNGSNTFSINYLLEVGVSKIVQSTIKPEVMRVPIFVGPYVSPSGSQYSITLDRDPIIMEEATIKELKQSVINRRISSISSSSAPSSIAKLHSANSELTTKLKQNFVDLISSDETDLKNIDELVELQIKAQFGTDQEDDKMNVSQENENTEESNYISKRVSTVRKNIAALETDYGHIIQNETQSKDNDGPLIAQLVNLQNTYKINKDGQNIATLSLLKPFYTSSDDIDFVLSFPDETTLPYKVSAVTASLESFELIHPKFNLNASELKLKPKGNTVYESHAISFDECKSIPFKLILPKSPSNQLTGQFKTDVFQLKWMLVFKFVLIAKGDETTLEQFYEDKRGFLLHAKESLEGEELICHVSLPILPSSHAYGGW